MRFNREQETTAAGERARGSEDAWGAPKQPRGHNYTSADVTLDVSLIILSSFALRSSQPRSVLTLSFGTAHQSCTRRASCAALTAPILYTSRFGLPFPFAAGTDPAAWRARCGPPSTASSLAGPIRSHPGPQKLHLSHSYCAFCRAVAIWGVYDIPHRAVCRCVYYMPQAIKLGFPGFRPDRFVTLAVTCGGALEAVGFVAAIRVLVDQFLFAH